MVTRANNDTHTTHTCNHPATTGTPEDDTTPQLRLACNRLYSSLVIRLHLTRLCGYSVRTLDFCGWSRSLKPINDG